MFSATKRRKGRKSCAFPTFIFFQISYRFRKHFCGRMPRSGISVTAFKETTLWTLFRYRAQWLYSLQLTQTGYVGCQCFGHRMHTYFNLVLKSRRWSACAQRDTTPNSEAQFASSTRVFCCCCCLFVCFETMAATRNVIVPPTQILNPAQMVLEQQRQINTCFS